MKIPAPTCAFSAQGCQISPWLFVDFCLLAGGFADVPSRMHRRCRCDCATATVAPRAFVLASSISLAPPQAAGLVHSAARPLQTANATLVCCLVPFLSCQKKVCKKEAQDAEIALTREKTRRSILHIIVTLQVKERPSGGVLTNSISLASAQGAKARPLRCSSFPKHKRFAGLCFGSLWFPYLCPLNI